jgi:uncharacterized protein (DUF433 family)
MSKDYVEKREGGYWVAGTRVSLDSIVYAFLRGVSPEGIEQSFPVLKLEEVFGAITYYLAHQAELDQYLRAQEKNFAALEQQSRKDNSQLYKKLEDARQHPITSRK